MQSAQQQVKRRRRVKREKRRREAKGEKRGEEQPINKNKKQKEREMSTKTEKQQNRKQLWCDCSVCRSVGGLQLVAQRCFCRQRSYQRDHARSRLILIAEAKPVWARSVLLWVTRWESRVMLLSLFFFFSNPLLSLFFLFPHFFFTRTRTLVASIGWLVGWFIWLAVSLSSSSHTRTLSSFLGVCSSCCCLH